MRLENKIAIITGGANGIGRATVEIFLREGAAVEIADRDCKNGSALAETSTRALFVETDVSSDRSVADLVAKTVAHFGGVDALVNNAAIRPSSPFLEMDEEKKAYYILMRKCSNYDLQLCEWYF